jgi:PKD repeat protein
MLRLPKARKRHRSRGQSVVEFALMLPVFLLLIFGGIDFGRVFLGWINLNNTARIAANYAASNAVQLNNGDPVAVAAYNKLVTDDATATNCTPPAPLPAPTYTPDTALGSSATVQVSCSFKIFTPIISSILGNNVTVSSSAVFPIRRGVIAGVPGGGPAPAVAGFNINPSGGVAPTTITFTDASSGTPISYDWDFDGDGVTDYSADGNPPPWTYSVPGTYQASLTVSNGVTPTTATKTIVITAPVGPVANFDLALSSPTDPSTVTFTNTSTGNPTSWLWKFGDGTPDSILQDPPSKVYHAGTWTVSLKVDNALGTSTTTKTFTVVAPIPMCPVPDFKNLKTDVVPSIQARWQAAGFSTTVIFNPSRPPEYKITKQSLKKDDSYPCAGTVITVFDH